jgi:hypothetical protein
VEHLVGSLGEGAQLRLVRKLCILKARVRKWIVEKKKRSTETMIINSIRYPFDQTLEFLYQHRTHIYGEFMFQISSMPITLKIACQNGTLLIYFTHAGDEYGRDKRDAI